LQKLPDDGAQHPDPYRWIIALRARAIKKLMADDGPLQLSLFDQQDPAEITSPDFPGERLIACGNPALAAQRARKREDLLQATGNSSPPHRRHKSGKHFNLAITDTRGYEPTCAYRRHVLHSLNQAEG
jgi:hypothetical protein